MAPTPDYPWMPESQSLLHPPWWALGGDSTYTGGGMSAGAGSLGGGMWPAVHGAEAAAEEICFWPPTDCWSRSVAAFIVAAAIVPLGCLKDVSLFAKLSSAGAFFLMYVMVFIVVQSVVAGPTASSPHVADVYSPNFPHLGGILVSSFFMHHAVIPVTRSARYPEHNKRNIVIAYVIAMLWYIIPGIVGNFSQQFVDLRMAPGGAFMSMNFLNAFPPTSAFAMSARVAMGALMASVFPLLLYIMRTQLFGLIFGKSYPGFWRVLIFNVAILGGSSALTVMQVGIGSILRYVGSFCGLYLVFLLPVGIHCRVLHVRGELTAEAVMTGGAIVALGVSLLAMQFIPTGRSRTP